MCDRRPSLSGAVMANGHRRVGRQCGGRVHGSCAAERYSFVLTFPLTEQRAAVATLVAHLKRRKMRRLSSCKQPEQTIAYTVKPIKKMVGFRAP